MGNVNDLAAMIEADRAATAELSGPIESSKGQAESIESALAGWGFTDRAARVKAVGDRIEEAQALRAALEDALVKAYGLAMMAAQGTTGRGASGTGAVAPVAGSDDATGAPKGGLDAVPPHLRQDQTPTGEELTGVDSTLGPFQKEHENANADRSKNRLSRFGRSAVQNVEDLQSFGRDLTTSTKHTGKGFDPADPGTYPTTTEVPSHTPQIHSPTAGQPDPTDVVGTAIVMAAVVAEGIGRLIDRRRRHDGE